MAAPQEWHRAPLYVAVSVLVLGLIISVGAVERQGELNDRMEKAAVASRLTQVATELPLMVQGYEKGVRGARGAILVGGQEHISPSTFLVYIGSRDIDTEFPGTQGFGFISRFAAGESPAGHVTERDVITLIEPRERNLESWGFDLATDERAQRAAVLAMESGHATLSAPLRVGGAAHAGPDHLFLLLPVYRPGLPLSSKSLRLAAAVGWACASLRIDTVLGLFMSAHPDLVVQIRDLGPPGAAEPFFRSGSGDDHLRSELTQQRILDVYGRHWSVVVQPTPALLASLNLVSPRSTGLAGLLISSLLSALSYAISLLERRRRDARLTLSDLNAELERSVSDRTAALEIVVRNNEALLRTLHDYALVSVADKNGRIIDVNPAFCISSGYSREELIGQDHRVLNSGTHPQAFWKDFWDTLSAGQSWRGEICNRAKDGSLLWMNSMVAPFLDDAGRVAKYISIRDNITERRRAAQELLEVSSLLHLVLESASEISVIATDPELRIKVFNAGAERLLGYRSGEIVGIAMLENFHDADEIRARGEELSALHGRTIVGDAVFTEPSTLRQPREWTYVHKDGHRLPVALVMTAMFAPDGALLGYLGIAHDVTRQIEYEASLREAMTQAKQANTAKSEFLANMSHEIRTPLNAVIGLGYLLDLTHLTADQRQLLAKIQFAGRSLLGVVNNVLDLSKIESGEMELDSEPFDLPTVMQAVSQMLAPQAASKGIELLTDVADSLPSTVLGDEGRLRQVLVNLVNNSIKFTEHGHVKIRLFAAEHSGARLRLRCEVNDTGIGITPEALERVFTPFTQADTSTTRRFGGTGLGLSITRRFVQMMGGEIGVTSAVGVGSTFWFEIPFSIIRPGDAAAGPSGIGLRILIATSRDGTIEGLGRQIRALGWNPRVASSGRELNDLMANADPVMKPDVVITDQRLGDMDALELIAQMDAEAADRARSPVIIIAESMQAYLRYAPMIRENDLLLAGPVTSSTLFNAVNAVVSRNEGGHERLLQATNFNEACAEWLAGVRILIVDDSSINVEVARRILERQGAVIMTCTDGLAAIEFVRNHAQALDIVLMDVQMPVLDGNTATQCIRAELKLPRLPIVGLTAGALLGERQRCLESGMNDVVTKPFDPQSLIRKLRGLVEDARGEALPVVVREQSAQTHTAATGADGVPASLDARIVQQLFDDDIELFDDLLGRLLREFGDFALPFEPMSGDDVALVELQGRVHKLKGSSGMVGATNVTRWASALESSLRARAGAAEIRRISAQLAAALTTLGEESRRYFGRRESSGNDPAAAALTHSRLSPAGLEEWRMLLASHNLAAIDKFDELARSLREHIGEDRFGRLKSAVADLDFTLALRFLREAFPIDLTTPDDRVATGARP